MFSFFVIWFQDFSTCFIMNPAQVPQNEKGTPGKATNPHVWIQEGFPDHQMNQVKCPCGQIQFTQRNDKYDII